jgi:hypothetical protein
MIVENSRGNYSFIRGIGPFSAAVSATSGFEIVHARFLPMAPLNEGYAYIERHLKELGRPVGALCGMELRIAKPLSREAFDEFNRPYIERLRGWGLEINGDNPVTRTNVAFETTPLSEPMLAGFYYTVPSDTRFTTFVLSGVPEIASRDGGVQIVARGDTSPEGLRSKVECVIQVLGALLAELGLKWEIASTVNLYTVHDVHPIMTSSLLAPLGTASHRGITWHYARPPVNGLEVEIDARAVRTESILEP